MNADPLGQYCGSNWLMTHFWYKDQVYSKMYKKLCKDVKIVIFCQYIVMIFFYPKLFSFTELVQKTHIHKTI